MNYVIRGTLLVALALIVTGCAGARSGANDFKAEVVEPAPDAGFIEHPERQTTHGDLPFQKVWMKPGMDWNQYQELIVSPVNTQHMHKMDWLHRMSSANWAGDVKGGVNRQNRESDLGSAQLQPTFLTFNRGESDVNQ